MPNRADPTPVVGNLVACPRSAAFPTMMSDGLKHRHRHLQQEEAGALTTGKHGLQDSLPMSGSLLASLERHLRLRRMALLIEFAPDLDAHRKEFEEVLLLPL